MQASSFFESLESRTLLAGNGLTAVYSDHSDFTGATVQRVDKTVNFNWGRGAPAPGISADTFSVRWTGLFQPKFSETYTFYAQIDDGARLWINGKKLVDSWKTQSATQYSGRIALKAGRKYDIRYEYYENDRDASAKLMFSSASTPKCVVPTSSLYTYTTRFAAIGDYGQDGTVQADVAKLVKKWSPEFILSLGDNNYHSGQASTIDRNIGKYYSQFIGNYKGSYGSGASSNAFFPTLGNHDWMTDSAAPYLKYFTLPGNERYYDFVKGPIHFFVVNSNPQEPDGISSTSKQAMWLKSKLAASTSPWNVVSVHHPPYTSSVRGSNTPLQWPFAAWGADAVLSGHEHLYERVMKTGVPFFINGAGGRNEHDLFSTPISGSTVRNNTDFGAMLIQASDDVITCQFISRTGDVLDLWTDDTP